MDESDGGSPEASDAEAEARLKSCAMNGDLMVMNGFSWHFMVIS